MTSTSTIKVNWLVVINIAFLVLFAIFFVMYLNGSFDRNNGAINTSKGDTARSQTIAYVPQPTQIVPQYQPVIYESKAPASIPVQYKATSSDTALLNRYNQIINILLTSNRILDSIPLKDSSGKKVGIVRLDDVVQENTIKSRNPSYQLTFPVITNSSIVTPPVKPVNQVFIGGGISGTQESLIQAFKAGLLFKNKKDQVFGINAGIGSNAKIMYGVESYWKIKLHK